MNTTAYRTPDSVINIPLIKVVQELSTSDIFNPQTFKIGEAKSKHVQNLSKMSISSPKMHKIGAKISTTKNSKK